jgi:hypothetical protein
MLWAQNHLSRAWEPKIIVQFARTIFSLISLFGQCNSYVVEIGATWGSNMSFILTIEWDVAACLVISDLLIPGLKYCVVGKDATKYLFFLQEVMNLLSSSMHDREVKF